MEEETLVPIELIEKYLTRFESSEAIEIVKLIKESFISGIDHCPHCAKLYE